MPDTYIDWSSSYYNPGTKMEDAASASELYDLLGTNSYGMPRGAKIPPLVNAKPIPLLELTRNCTLSSNQTIKCFPQKNAHIAHNTSSKTSQGTEDWKAFILEPVTAIDGGGSRFKARETLKALYWTTLPDILSEYKLAAKIKEYWDMPSAALTAIFNSALFLFHAVAQTAQLLCHALSTPTQSKKTVNPWGIILKRT